MAKQKILKRKSTGATITLNDVAAEAGVHRTTVSQVLNNRATCWASQKTREKIHAAAQKLGYRPNLAAKALRIGRSHVIGFVSPGFGVAAEHSWASGLNDAAARKGYSVTLSSHPNDSESEDLLIRKLIDRGVDGLAVYPVDSGPHEELRRLVENGFPLITFEGANLLDFSTDDVSVDLEAAGKEQARHLLERGRKKICIAQTKPLAKVNDKRDEAVRRELIEAGAPEPLELVLSCPEVDAPETPEAICRQIHNFIDKHKAHFDGVIAVDPIASLIVRSLLGEGIAVPDEVAVIGYGDERVASHGVIPLSSIHAHTDRLAAEGFNILLDRMENSKGKNSAKKILGGVELMARRSTSG